MPPQQNEGENAMNASPFNCNFLSIDNMNRLLIGDKVDYRNDDGKFVVVSILAKKRKFTLIKLLTNM